MIHSKYTLLICALLIPLCFTANVFAKSSVWKISSGDDYFYLGGTFHILSPEDHPLPEEFVQAYSDAREVIFETDMEVLSSPEFQQKLIGSMMFNDERTLSGELEPETYSRLKAFMDSRQLPMNNFAKFQPWGVSLILALQEYAALGMAPEYGLESYFGERAIDDKKTIQSLETPEQQLEFMQSLAGIDPDLNINYTLRDLEKSAEYIQDLKVGWRTGDLPLLASNPSFVQMEEEFPTVYSALLVTRNENWMKQLVRLFDDNEIEIVLVGALHLVGQDGLIKQLQLQGFVVEQLE